MPRSGLAPLACGLAKSRYAPQRNMPREYGPQAAKAEAENAAELTNNHGKTAAYYALRSFQDGAPAPDAQSKG
jgi:hypothetical protein